MITRYYSLGQPLDINKVVNNMKKQIDEHLKKNDAKDVIVSVCVASVSENKEIDLKKING